MAELYICEDCKEEYYAPKYVERPNVCRKCYNDRL